MDTTELPQNLSAPDCLISDDASKCETLILIRKVFASFSFLGCMFIILVICKFRKYRVLEQRLILFLTIGALLNCISYFMNDTIADGTWCDFQAFWLTYFDWTVLLWVSCLTFHLYLLVFRSNKDSDASNKDSVASNKDSDASNKDSDDSNKDQLKKNEKFYHLLCWSLPVLFSVLPFIHDKYGPAGAWCWIKRGNIGWRLGIWYVPLFTIIILMSLANLRIHRNMKDFPEEEDGLNHLRYYPLVYLLVSLFPLAHRICNAFDKDYFWLMVIASMCAPLHGVSNAIVFGLDKVTRNKLCQKHPPYQVPEQEMTAPGTQVRLRQGKKNNQARNLQRKNHL